MKKINIFAMFMIVSGVSFGSEGPCNIDRYQRPCTSDKRHDVLLQKKLNYGVKALGCRAIDSDMLALIEQCCGLENKYISIAEYQYNIFWAEQIWVEYVTNPQCSEKKFKNMCDLMQHQKFSVLDQEFKRLHALWEQNLAENSKFITDLSVA